jgi:hypothetical protein
MGKALELIRPLFDYISQVFIACDQLLNALWPSFLWGHLSYADETLSARCYRANRDDLVLGRLFMPLIDILFIWQGPGHCFNAYRTEVYRRNMPPEYRNKTATT